MNIILSDSFFPLLEIKCRYLHLNGGAGSGKSEFAARKHFVRCEREGGHRLLNLRKVRRDLKDSVIKVFRSILEANGVDHDYNKSDLVITFFSPSGKRNELLFYGMDDWQRLKSIKGITGIWMEEATQFSREEMTQIDLLLREATPHYKQIMLTYNPDERMAKWLKDLERAKDKDPNYYFHHSIVEDNPITEVREEYLKVLDAIDDKTLRDIYRKGLWAMPKGLIFNWPEADPPPGPVDETIYGGDFGYSINEAAFVRIRRKALKFWAECLIYEIGLTNPMLAERVKAEPGVDLRDPSYWDSAEPKSIQEICDRGLNAFPSEKFPGSVEEMIRLAQGLDISIVRGSTALLEERGTYKWKEDKSGNPTGKPVEFHNHAIMASLYGICTHYWKYLRPRKKKGKFSHLGMKPKGTEAQEKGGEPAVQPEAQPGQATVQATPPPAIPFKGEEYGRRKGKFHYIC
jgi:phage terminase large subunit